eukprot:Nitzschia sp. Nitz4//scaffold110_size71422//43038//44439//NITZ4_005876-RA/size71422-augustus-gene-0.12-mRNA-1//1//CDS//3329533095//1968//frame0
MSKTPMLKDGWFNETAPMWPGQKGPEKNAILYRKKSKYQEILIFQSAQYGKVFVIDGVVQLTEHDEHAFHEMMAHIPLFAHSNPEKVLIVGGGDGGVLKEVCRHSCVKEITVVEIDEMVIQACKEHLCLATDKHYNDPRVSIVYEDASEYLNEAKQSGRFDVIMADTLDPLGPAESLFEPEFYESMHDALADGGIICTQGESMWIHLDLIGDLVECCAQMFGQAEYAITSVPCYPCGQIGFILARKGSTEKCRTPVRHPTFQDDLRYYNPQVHKAAFVLPQFVEKTLGPLFVSKDNDEEDDEEEEMTCFLGNGCQIQ